MCISGTARFTFTPASFDSIASIHVEKSSIYIAIVSLSSPSYASILFVFGWLVDDQLVAAYTKSQKFLEITQIHCFYSILLKKMKNKKPTS